MADEQDGPPAARDLTHLAKTLLLELRVADRQHLVDDQNLGLEMRGNREGQPDVHPAAVALDRRVEKLLGAGKRHDVIELARDLRARHAENRAVQEDVLAARQLGMKARSDFEQA